MFNTLPYNDLRGGEFNGTGVGQRTILLAATATVDVSATPPVPEYTRSLAATATVDVSAATPTLDSLVILGAVATVDVSSTSTMFRVRELHGEGLVETVGIIGGSLVHELEGSATVEVTGELLPYDFLAGGDVTAEVTAVADLTRIRILGGTGAVEVTADLLPMVGQRRMFADATVQVTATANPDTYVGGVRFAELAGDVSVDVDAVVTIDPTKFLYAAATVEVSATGSYTRIRHYFGTGIIEVEPDVEMFPLKAALFATGTVEINGVVTLVRIANLAASVSVEVTATPVPLKADRFLAAAATVEATGAVAMTRWARMRADATVEVAGIGDVKPAVRLEGGATVEVSTTADLSYFTMHYLGATDTVEVSATADLYRTVLFGGEATVEVSAAGAPLRINALSYEPPFRTLIVEPELDTFVVEPEDFVVVVFDDGGSMQTFQKQPADHLPYDVDFRQWFERINAAGDATDDIDFVSAEVVSATVGPIGDLAITDVIVVRTDPDDANSPGYRVKVWCSGGRDGATYKLTVRMTSNAGRVKEVDFKLKIKEI